MEKLKLLVVDDEPGIRSGINRILRDFTVGFPFMDEDFGFDILEAETGEIAIEIVDNESPDIVLLDNKLPGMQGVEVLEYINKKNRDIFVIMITSYASLELAVKATRDGAYDFVPKPFTPQELRSSMENVTKTLYLRRVTKKLNKEGKQIRFQFLQVLSHELKAPLNAIEGYLNMIKDRQFGQEMDKYDEIIDRSMKRIGGMRSLIMDLLDLTQIESGKKKRDLQKVNLVTIAKSAIDTMTPYAIQKDIDIYLNANEDISIEADHDEMEILFNNLISNAIKYNKDKGRVDLSVKLDSDYILIVVSDTGIGFKEEEIKDLFNAFYRIKNEQTKNISGSGLGLSIVKGIIDMYNGEINVSSIPGEGTTFTIKLTNK